ncbi:MAG: tetratricopeptide repeat protein [Synechococcales bacterium]|nr:tetratricopeptide repeat protein [Synechococcales bacterium]
MTTDPTYMDTLLQNLKSPDEAVREMATQKLWRAWFEQKGLVGFQVLQRAQELIDAEELNQAEVLLSQLIQNLPDFAEAWNRRAVLYFMQRRYRKAIADCQQVVQLNANHFGALHGLGLCYAALEDYRAAIQAFQRVLAIHPYAVETQRLLLECTAHLS